MGKCSSKRGPDANPPSHPASDAAPSPIPAAPRHRRRATACLQNMVDTYPPSTRLWLVLKELVMCLGASGFGVKRPSRAVRLLAVAFGFLASISYGEPNRSNLFGVLNEDGTVNLQRAEELFGEFGRVSRIVTLGSDLVPAYGKEIDQVFLEAINTIGPTFSEEITFQLSTFVEGDLGFLRFSCPGAEKKECVFDPNKVYTVPANEYDSASRRTRLHTWTTWELESANYLPGYAVEGGELGLRFTLKYLENGEPDTLDIFEVYPVNSKIVRLYRQLFLQDHVPERRAVHRYRYYFQAEHGVTYSK